MVDPMRASTPPSNPWIFGKAQAHALAGQPRKFRIEFAPPAVVQRRRGCDLRANETQAFVNDQLEGFAEFTQHADAAVVDHAQTRSFGLDPTRDSTPAAFP